ncbi:hypothetical protein AMTRI_Chr03g138820 [Amborella trichopoda]
MTPAVMAPLTALLFFSSLPFLSLPRVSSQLNKNITLGTSLLSSSSNDSYRVSPSGEFAFGFYSIDRDQFLIGIWFAAISEKTLVWSANRDQPVQDGSIIQFTLDGKLGFTDSHGQQSWIYNGTDAATSASILDTGSFVLLNSRSSIVWQSFDHPTDTLLPGQSISEGTNLASSRLERDYRTGRYLLGFQTDGNLVLYQKYRQNLVPNVAYYASGTDGANSPLTFVFNRTGNLYLINSTNQIISTISSNIVNPVEDYYQRATLDFDGFFRQYSLLKNPNNGESWTRVSTIPGDKDACSVPGICGLNGYCVLNQDEKVECRCPHESFSFIDPNYTYAGCKNDFSIGCDAYSELDYSFSRLDNIDWPYGDYERLDSDMDVEKCMEACKADCWCDAAIYRTQKCWKKRMPLTDGREDGTLGGTALIKIRERSPAKKEEKEGQNLFVVGGFLISASAFLFLLTMVVIAYSVRRRRAFIRIPTTIENVETNLIPFKYSQLQAATDGFKERLGNGSFGSVYKGVIELGDLLEIAVKRLDKIVERGEKEFRTELSVIGRTHHKNLVRLVGFCDEGNQRLIVYEFMSNGSLADFLFGSIRPTWGERTRLAFGIARGIMYLHDECESPIIHCDIKPQNILLDRTYTPKIADFGLAKLLQSDQTRTDTDIRGTRGYVAPEWFRNVPISAKVDVYSFGIMLLEIVCCKRRMDLSQGLDKQVILSDWVYDCFYEGMVHELVEGDEEALDDVNQVERLVKVGLWCIQQDPSVRPSMKAVVQMIEGTIEVGVPPSSSSIWS